MQFSIVAWLHNIFLYISIALKAQLSERKELKLKMVRD